MAWRDKDTLTCPNCGRTEDFVWVLGVPLDRNDTGKGYRRAHRPGGWIVTKGQTEQTVSCPDCHTDVTRKPLTART